ncbi:protein of unknown function [Bradyrhizobium vignae]|uniref:Uncharacterized protein n=1 Tax=Bradyrhizobium vignae TaxID=1549949 RepID=A0A2U3Q4G7_9BRAD|nr:protein of unknown function [Bradyrhizobium vignae]
MQFSRLMSHRRAKCDHFRRLRLTTGSVGHTAAIAARVLLGRLCKFRIPSRRPISASHSALKRLISPLSVVDAALSRQSIGSDFALLGTMGTTMFKSEATGVTAISSRPARSREPSINTHDFSAC